MEKKIKKTILYIITQSELGGAQRYVFDLAAQLGGDFNIRVAFGEPGEAGQLARDLRKLNIEYFVIPYLRRALSPVRDWLALFNIIRLLRKIKPDIVHLNSTKVSILGSLARIFCTYPSPKFIYTAHGWVFNEPLSFCRKLFYKYSEKFTSIFKDKVICVSAFDLKTAQKEKIVPRKKLIFIANGITKNNFFSAEEARRRLNEYLPKKITNTYLIGSIGNFYKTKGFEYFIETINVLIKSEIMVRAVIIGEGDERRRLEKLIKKYGLENYIFLPGCIDHAARFLKAFDIYICSSVKEGLSYTIIEAMSAELPIIATEVGGNPELIKHEQTGILIEPANSKLIAVQIKRLLDNHALRDELAVNARRRAEEEFNLEKMVRKTREVYEK